MSDVADDSVVDDEVVDSPRRPGRKVRALSDPFSRGSAAHAPKCRECPKHDAAHSVCPMLGAHQPGQAPACRYGIVLIRAKRMADRRAQVSRQSESIRGGK